MSNESITERDVDHNKKSLSFTQAVRIITHFKKKKSTKVGYVNDNITKRKGDYQITICQDGKFAVTFDTGKE